MHDRAVARRRLQEAHQQGSLFYAKGTRGYVEERLGSYLKAKSVASKADRIKVHSKNLLLGVRPLELYSHDPLLSLYDECPNERDITKEAFVLFTPRLEEILGQLLRERTPTPPVPLQEYRQQEGPVQPPGVNASMRFKPMILRS